MKRKRASFNDTCLRWWARYNNTIVRFLQVDRCDEYGNVRSFLLQLPRNDPRPKGVHMHGMTNNTLAQLVGLPQGHWCELLQP